VCGNHPSLCAGLNSDRVLADLKARNPHARTGARHHGRHEFAVYVVKGHGQIRWGERLEFTSEVGAGDFAYIEPHVPHQQPNVANETLDFVVVRSDNEKITVSLDIAPVENPESVEN
jgi:uncharacterized RmlC-like cupin family protein